MPPRILVVDRAANLLRVSSELLQEEGFEVVTVNLADDAALRALDPTAILIDLESSDDLALVHRLAAACRTDQLVVVVPFGCTHLALQAMSCGASDYIVKPLSRLELLVVIAKAIEHDDLAREVAELRRELRRRDPDTEPGARTRILDP